MPITFNSILSVASLDPADIRLLRHKDNRSVKGRSPYELWRDDRSQFDLYQSIQSLGNQAKLRSRYWASFVGTPDDETLFAGLFSVDKCCLLDRDTPKPHAEGLDVAGGFNRYELTLQNDLSDLVGRLVIEWGPGDRAWIQRADQQNKLVKELRKEFKEPGFPGFLHLIESLSRLSKFPAGWVEVLRSAKGVYLLTCPRTKEQYVGSAIGANGFWGRWQQYIQTGHGGNVALKSRDPSDYQVSILEVAGTSCQDGDILVMEQRWKAKLQSQEMGLNRN